MARDIAKLCSDMDALGDEILICSSCSGIQGICTQHHDEGPGKCATRIPSSHHSSRQGGKSSCQESCSATNNPPIPPLTIPSHPHRCRHKTRLRQYRGTDTPLAVNLLFNIIRNLQIKVGVLTEWSKNTGVIFDRQAFSSETKFAILFIKHNEAGEGLAVWVDIISIWAFGAVDHIDTTQWLTEIH